MFDINNNKAPGPYGYTVKFYKKAWSIMGENICEAVMKFFKTGKLLSEISHLRFADDLLILCHGDLKSVKVIKAALDKFSGISGLNPNMGKSTVFFRNLKEDVKNEILKILPFKVGKLPVTYLGVPLITKQIDIYRLLKGFLWCQGDLSRGKAKVAWKNICKPKNQSGLGIRDLAEWNECLMGKHIWNVASNKESLWVKCFNEVKLKGKSIWEVKIDTRNDNQKDYTVWKYRAGILTKFIVQKPWKVLRKNEDEVPWFKAVWFSHYIARNAFILWLAMIGRLATQDRIMKWYHGRNTNCLLCNNCPDSVKHLFFECSLVCA
ncbi:RNA-directed DNA polymerase, eukaryota, reverse transcriptase zinc-binding domain protein [Tanacetum coccineum]